jgi:ABC-2 type transport system permease protein
MTLFLRITRLAFQQQITYRAATLSGLATNFFFALLRVAVIKALYGNQSQVNGLSLQGAITFVAVSQGMIAFMFLFGFWDLMGTVYNGSIGADLLKPLHLYTLWMARTLGRSLANLIFRGLMLIAFFALVYPVVVPNRLEQWLALLLALALAWLVNFSWEFLVNLAAFWTPDARGIGRVAFTLSSFLSGFIMPLRLYPDWFSNLCRLTPFPAMINTPVEVYLGVLTGKDLWMALLNQLIWVVVFALVCEWALRAGVRRLVIQGG